MLSSPRRTRGGDSGNESSVGALVGAAIEAAAGICPPFCIRKPYAIISGRQAVSIEACHLYSYRATSADPLISSALHVVCKWHGGRFVRNSYTNRPIREQAVWVGAPQNACVQRSWHGGMS